MGAYGELGVRATVTIYQPDKGEDEWFPFLPELLEPDLLARFRAERPPPAAEIIATYREFIARWHGAAGGRLRCGVSPSAPQRATEAYLLGLHELAAEHDLPFVLHVYESKVQRVSEQLVSGRSLVRSMRDLGVLDRRSCVVHAVWIDEADIADLASSGATVVHSPSGNLRCGSGQLPYRPLLDAGVPIALCTDEATVEDTNNLWNVGRLAALIHKNAGPDYREWPKAAEILDALTTGGARAMGLSGAIGTLEVGARADLILLDLSTPVFLPLTDLANHLVYGEDGSSVRRVIVDGNVVVSDGRVLTIDEDRTAGRGSRADAGVARGARARRRLGRAPSPGVRGDVPALRRGGRRVRPLDRPPRKELAVPYIEVKAFDRRIDDASARRVIEKLTDALCDALGEEVREATWVVVEGVPPSRWGIAGQVSS